MANPLDFSKRSRRALFQFVLLLLVVALLPRSIELIGAPDNIKFSQSAFEKKAWSKHKWTGNKTFRFYRQSKTTNTVPPQRFDPNQYAASDWMQLGLSAKQAAIVVKFGKHGFYSPEDLKRVFVISDQFFNRIKDSLVFPVKVSKLIPEKQKTVKWTTVELNLATEDELKTLPGIGDFFAKKIIERRSRLGGFVGEHQLLEIWKMDSTKLQQLSPYFKIDPSLVQPIYLNSISLEELRKHPYLNWNIANSIIKLREQHGPFQQIEAIKKSKLIDDALFEKLKPYLSL